MELYVVCIVVGALLAALFVMIGMVIAYANKRDNKDYTKCECNNNSILRDGGDNMRNRVMGDFNKSINSGQDMGLEDKAEKAIIKLNSIRAGATRSECEAIDFAVDCIGVRIRLEKFFKERGV